ncbi:hypothetical protein BJ165DRAFT_1417408 [Panaeolus papilionaceus]|nr:hypothetical protein BJ165DRAFT_1417408 [Panaeolus papilionaceus]
MVERTHRVRKISQTSTLSRIASLIKKNIGLNDLRQADVLIEGFLAWKVMVKQLCSYLEGIAGIENNTPREMSKLSTVIQVPFRSGNQFLGEGGLQDIYYTIRDKTRIIADQHADLGRTIDRSIEREQSTRLVGQLANVISTFKNTPMNLQAKSDPYIVNQAVSRQLTRQVLEENLLQKSIVMMQQNSAHFEGGIVRAIQSAWATFDEWQSLHQPRLKPSITEGECLLDPETPLRSAELVRWPLMDELCVQPLHVGHLERKKRFTRNRASAYFILPPAGFLHEFASSHPSGGGNAKAFSFRARSHEELMEWWKDIRMLDVVDKKGLVEQAVRSVGYTEEEMEEEEEFKELEVAEERVRQVVGGKIDHDHEGSSVEEERGVEVVDNEEAESDHEGSVRGGGGEKGASGVYLGPKAPASLTSERAKATHIGVVMTVDARLMTPLHAIRPL